MFINQITENPDDETILLKSIKKQRELLTLFPKTKWKTRGRDM